MTKNKEKQIKKLETKIKRLDNKIANTNLYRQIYILGPMALAVLTGVATIISIPLNLIVFQILGVSTLALAGLTFGLNAISDFIDLRFSIKLRKLESKFEKLKTEYSQLVDQTKTNNNVAENTETVEDQEVVTNNGNDISLQKLLEEGKRTNEIKLVDVESLVYPERENDKFVQKLLEKGKKRSNLKKADKIVVNNDDVEDKLNK